jgi:hypothetical protein
VSALASDERPLTTGQAARILLEEYGLRLSARTLNRRCDDGTIDCTKTSGGDRRISHEALRAFAETALH